MKYILKKLAEKQDLSFDEIAAAVEKIAAKEATDAQISAFITALTSKGVSKEEFYALAKSMRNYARRVVTGKYIVDSCGTGADMSGTVNISTAAAIAANACGVNIVKQTNSSVTSVCGSTDLLGALGVKICAAPESALEQFRHSGITFVHSPYFNAFAEVNNPIRQQIGFKTVFNYLGPLINASFPEAQLLGVSSNEMLEKCAYALQKLGTDRALVVNGLEPNLDEISVCSQTRVLELKNGEISEYLLSPEDFGMRRVHLQEIQGESAADNAQLIAEVFNGVRTGAHADVIALNAGAMVYLAGLEPSVFNGVKAAQKAIKDGLAAKKLEELQCYQACLI